MVVLSLLLVLAIYDIHHPKMKITWTIMRMNDDIVMIIIFFSLEYIL